MDFGIVFDGSSSTKNFHTAQKEFAKSFAREFGISQSGSRIGVAVFSERASVALDLEEINDIEAFAKQIDDLQFPGGLTHIDSALKAANR